MRKAWDRLERQSWILSKVRNISYRQLFFICVVVFIIGIIINIFNPYPLFFVHQACLLTIFIISFYAVKSFLYFFDELLPAIRTNPQVVGESRKAERKLFSRWGPFFAIMTVIFYFINIILLAYIEIDMIGCYAIVLGGIALFTAIIGYYQFIQLILYIFRLSKSEISSYNRFIPASTIWLVEITEKANLFKNVFFVLGLMFTIEYAILIPKDALSFSTKFTINISPSFSFVLTWLGIVVFIIFAFPIFAYTIKMYIKRIISKLKNKTIREFEKLLSKDLEKSSVKDAISIDRINMYAALIGQVESSRNYPIEDSTAPLSILLSLATIGVHFTVIFKEVYHVLI